MKKQICFTAALFVCALAVVIFGFDSSSDDYEASLSVTSYVTFASASAALPPISESTSLAPPSSRIYLLRGLPFSLNKLSLISIILITLMTIFISLFIKPTDLRIKFLMDADGMK